MQNFFVQVKAMVSEWDVSPTTQNGTNSYTQDERDLTTEYTLALPSRLHRLSTYYHLLGFTALNMPSAGLSAIRSILPLRSKYSLISCPRRTSI